MTKVLSFYFLALSSFAIHALSQDSGTASSTTDPPTPTLVKAIIPTAPGQIGINPVSVPNIPETEIAGAPVGSETLLVTVVAGTTSWIGPGADAQPTTATTTVTISGKPTVIPYVPNDITFEISKDDSVSVAIGEWVRGRLQDLATKATPCTGAKLRRRTASCGFGSYAELVNADEALMTRLEGAIPELLETIAVTAANSNAQRAAALSAVAGVSGLKFIGLLYYTWPSQSKTIGSGSTGGKIPPIMDIKPDPVCAAGLDTLYVCEDKDCTGIPSKNRDETCTADGPKKGCKCMLTAISSAYAAFDSDAFDAFQTVLVGNDPPTCDKNSDSIDSNFAKGLVTTFCADNLGADKSASLNYTNSKTPGTWDGYKDWKFDFSWSPLTGICNPSDCEALFQQSINTCAFNSHSLAITSSYTASCGTGTWNFTSPNPPPSQPSSTPHAMGGVCELHLNETRTCDSTDSDLFGTIVVKDNINSIIFQQKTRTPINAKAPWVINLPLFADPLTIVGEHTNDYVQFTMGKSSWKSNETDSSAASNGWCSLGSWDPKGPASNPSLPNCNSAFQKNPTTTRQMDCSWRC